MLHVERRGTGPRLLYCNGSGMTLSEVRPVLDRLSRSFDLLAFDYRGMGASPPVTEPYTMADVAADVITLLDEAGWDRTAMAGLSFGGMVAQEFSVTHPDRVERLALLSTSPGGAISSHSLESLENLPAAERNARIMQLADRRWTREWLSNHPDQAALAAGFAAQIPIQETTEQQAGRLLQIQASRGHDVLDRLKNITCPTFVANGRYDDIAPVVEGQAIVDRVAGATMHVYDGGHLFVSQDPTAWPEITAFLGRAGTS